jgi:pimeloyl-ACP methyl ester carboxylesterase
MTKALRSRTAIIATVAACVVVGGVAVTDAGSATTRNAQGPSKPTIVLVHGAWADSSSWSGVIPRLQARGYNVIAPANPLRGPRSDSDYLRSVLKTISGPIVLVGHSYGGFVLTNAATGNANVKALVYVAAFAPDSGESVNSIEGINPGTQLGPNTVDVRPYPGGNDVYIKTSSFRSVFCADLSKRRAALLAATQRPLDAAAQSEGSGDPAWKTIPSWYMVATQDHAIPPATERFMAKRAGATTVQVKASHVAMISHPEAVVGLILKAAKSAA